jgi:methionyl-tRNA synthetase
MALVDSIRPGRPGNFMISAAYHTPNGHLHLGHLLGPFLAADVMARHFQTLGHRVVCTTATDAHEAYVLLSARVEGRSPEAVATGYYASARRTLAGFAMHQDSFTDGAAQPWNAAYHEHSHRIAAHLVRRGRIELRTARLPRSRRSGRYAVGPFALGECPACGASGGGTCCETCGMWFPPGDLVNPRPRLAEDGDLTWVEVPGAVLNGGPEFSVDEVERRFAPGYAELFAAYLRLNGPRIPVSHPLGWGVPWRAHPVPPEMVHVSYGTGSYAAMAVAAERYAEISGTGLDPFSRSGAVTTILTGGYDAALPCMFLLALMDDELDWQPYQHHVLNRFMRLNGEKFSTSRGHVIAGHAYLDAGLPADPVRMYAATIFPRDRESDFRPASFAAYVAGTLHERLDACVAQAVRDAETGEAEAGEAARLDPATAVAIGQAVARQVAALAPPGADLRAASAVVHDWLAVGASGMARTAPYWWAKAMAVLAFPFMPGWAGALWQALGAAGAPALAGFEDRGTPAWSRYVPVPEVPPAWLDRLAEPAHETAPSTPAGTAGSASRAGGATGSARAGGSDR